MRSTMHVRSVTWSTGTPVRKQHNRLKRVVTRIFRFASLVCVCLVAADALAQGTGTIKGHVHITGKLPGNSIIRMGMDPMCSKMNAGKRILQETFVATVDGSLGNAFVRL